MLATQVKCNFISSSTEDLVHLLRWWGCPSVQSWLWPNHWMLLKQHSWNLKLCFSWWKLSRCFDLWDEFDDGATWPARDSDRVHPSKELGSTSWCKSRVTEVNWDLIAIPCNTGMMISLQIENCLYRGGDCLNLHWNCDKASMTTDVIRH